MLKLLVSAISLLSTLTAFSAEPQQQQLPQRLNISSSVLRAMLESGQAQIEEISEEEALARAAAHGIELKTAPKSPSLRERPWFVVKGGVGIPGLLHGEIEVFVNDRISLEAGVAIGLLPTIYSAAINWYPAKTCFNCDGNNVFQLIFGPEFAIIPDTYSEGAEYYVGIAADAQYFRRIHKNFGIITGAKLSVGPTWGTWKNAPDYDENGMPIPGTGGETELRVEPAMMFKLYLGLRF